MSKRKKIQPGKVKDAVLQSVTGETSSALTGNDNMITRQVKLFSMILMSVAGLVFINTILNEYTGDDYYITNGSEQAMKGVSGIPEILMTPFATFQGVGGSYRATGRVSFAIGHQFFGFNPHVGHFFNVVFYILLILIIFLYLYEVFGTRYLFLIFLATLLYSVHPLRSEVVASLKSRDELFSAIFSFSACLMFVRYFKYNKIYYLLISSFLFLLALMSKESSQQFLAIAPLSAFIAGETNWKKILGATGVLTVVSAFFWLFLAYVLPDTQLLWMSEMKDPYPFFEHQLIYTDDPNIKYGTAFFGLLYYLRLLIYPFPLSFFYGYDLIPQVGFDDPRVILSILIYLSAGITALVLLRKRHIISFAILFYIITLSMFSNLVIQVAGVVADRFIFSASLGFSIIIAWLLLKIFRIPFNATLQKVISNKLFLVIAGVIIIVLSAKSIHRNFEWKNNIILAGADAERNPRSAMAHLYYAIQLKNELPKPGVDSATIVPLIVKHFKHVLDIYEPYPYAYQMLAIYNEAYYKDYNAAVKYMERAVDLRPLNRWFCNYLYDLYSKANSIQGQQLIMEHMLNYIPDAYEPHYFFGLQAFRNNNIPQSISSFEAAMKLGARDEEMLRFMQDYYNLNNMAAKLDTLRYYAAQSQ